MTIAPERAARLKAIAAAHRQWEQAWLPKTKLDPGKGAAYGGDYNLHYLDVSGTGAAEDAYQAATAHLTVAASFAAEFVEDDHPRDDHGKFAPAGGGDGGASGGEADSPPSIRSGQMSQGSRMSLDGYMSPDGNRIYNDQLRAGTADTRPDSAVADLDAAVASGEVTSEGTVYRGLAMPPGGPALAEGVTFTDHGYTSASTSLDTARDFAELRATGTTSSGNLSADPFHTPTGGDAQVLAIRLPVGQNAIYGDRSVSEVVLPRGLSYTITGTRPDGTLEASIAGGPAAASRRARRAAAAKKRKAKATEHPAGVIERMAVSADELEFGSAVAAEFNEDDHPRDDHGKFTTGGGEEGGQGGEASLDSKLDYEAIDSHAREWGDRADHACAEIWKANGYDTAPTRLVSEAEFGRLTSEEGYTACYRGVHGQDQAEADSFADQWKTGDQFAGEGIHGAGTYTTTDGAWADENYGEGSYGSGALLKIGLAPDANVISERDIDAQYAADKAAAAASGQPWSDAKASALDDPGRYASYKGYDAVSHQRADGSTWYMIQNRAATVTVR